MLTSKPPFQSSTVDEIYRRAREREYEWPTDDTRYISQEAKDLVASMLEDAEHRPEPDAIVQHPFFVTGYMPISSEITPRLREGDPGDDKFYDYATSHQLQALNLQTLKEMCRTCGVGPWNYTQLIHKAVWKEVAAEEAAGLTPIIPLAEGIVYRPFDDWSRENELKNRFAAQPPPPRQLLQPPSEPVSQPAPKSDETNALSQRVPAGLLRAPPQSFAAQQRAQNRPASATVSAVPQTEAPPPPAPAASTVRSRTKKEITLGRVLSLEGRELASRGTTRSLRGQPAQSKAAPTSEQLVKPLPERTGAPKHPRDESNKAERWSLFSPAEHQEQVPGTQPDVVLDRLQKLQTELERALNSRSMAIVSAKDKTPAPPQIVVKWVDYTKFGLGYILNDGSVGCILRTIPISDGNKSGVLPPACLLIHEAERHFQRKEDARYVDRQQIVPMAEGIYFYENNGEDGMSRVRASPENFRVSVAPDGTVGKLSTGRDIYDHRKRERIGLWKKFANYMLAFCRELEGPVEDAPARTPTLTDLTSAPSDVVTFYQRFGDVGCWVFCDGHMQVRTR